MAFDIDYKYNCCCKGGGRWEKVVFAYDGGEIEDFDIVIATQGLSNLKYALDNLDRDDLIKEAKGLIKRSVEKIKTINLGQEIKSGIQADVVKNADCCERVSKWEKQPVQQE